MTAFRHQRRVVRQRRRRGRVSAGLAVSFAGLQARVASVTSLLVIATRDLVRRGAATVQQCKRFDEVMQELDRS